MILNYFRIKKELISVKKIYASIDIGTYSCKFVVGEYYNHGAGILCRVTPDGVEISYIPISGYGTENGRN